MVLGTTYTEPENKEGFFLRVLFFRSLLDPVIGCVWSLSLECHAPVTLARATSDLGKRRAAILALLRERCPPPWCQALPLLREHVLPVRAFRTVYCVTIMIQALRGDSLLGEPQGGPLQTVTFFF